MLRLHSASRGALFCLIEFAATSEATLSLFSRDSHRMRMRLSFLEGIDLRPTTPSFPFEVMMPFIANGRTDRLFWRNTDNVFPGFVNILQIVLLHGLTKKL